MGPWPCSWEQASHRVSMTVLSCLMDFPVSDAPRNTAGDGLSDTLLQMNRNAVQESSARKRRASAMKPCEEPEAQLQGAQGSAWAPRVRSVGYCVAEHTDWRHVVEGESSRSSQHGASYKFAWPTPLRC